MAKKDIFERLSRTSDGRRRTTEAAPPAARQRGETVRTRVSKKVVRRRRKAQPADDAPERSETAVPVRRRAAAPVATDSAPAPEPVVAAPEPAPVPDAPAPTSTPAPVEAEAAPVTEQSVAASEPVAEVAAQKATDAAPTPVVEKAEPREAKPEPVIEAPASEPVAAKPAPEVAPAPEPKPEPAPTPKPKPKQRPYRGLGAAVVVPPPGYDPANPEAFRARSRQAAAAATSDSSRGTSDRSAGAATGRGARTGRRRVAESGGAAGGPGARPAGRGNRRRPSGGGRLAHRGRPRRRKKSGPKAPSPQPKAQKRKVRVDGAISVGQLAHELSVKAPLVIKTLMEMGTMATVNEMLDVETAALVASEFEYEVENVGFQEDSYLQHVPDEDDDESMDTRPPVVTIMGHVDHGKTTLLDTIRRSRVAAGEAGGITQHIGAYQVEWNDQAITFLDTPGHAAFTAMRARGASVTDLVVLVVACDDGVQPQTVEAINHAKAADVPIIVAVNKIDKPGVNPDTIRTRLGEHELIPEEWGGDTMFVNVSALKNQGIDDLLESIMLQSEILDLRANPERHAEGIVIEAKMERGRGAVASVIVQSGTLNRGDHVVLGSAHGRVRALMDHRGKQTKTAGPSTPVEIFGLSSLPNVGDALAVVANEKNARTLAEHRAEAERQAALIGTRRATVDDLRRLAGEDEMKTAFLVLKADVQGSLEALKAAILNLEVEGCEVRILHSGVGNISESDVNLVASNDGALIGFNVKVDARARKAADEAGVKPELHKVIYSVLDRVEGMLKGMLEPVYEEEHQGSAEVRLIFNISKIGTVAGSYVLDGKVGRNHGARVYRDGKEIWKGEVSSVKRFKDDVREVSSGYECGISLEGFNALEVGDVIETFAMVRVDPT